MAGCELPMTVLPTSEVEPGCVIADDEPRLRRVLIRLMTGDGFACEEAGNGQEALDALKRQPAARLITDMRMPRSGNEFDP